MADASLDVLADLRELEWRGIKVPCTANSIKGGHSLVEHNQYGVMGGEQESCCRKSAHFSFTIPFRNGITGYGVLYPTLFRTFWNACLDPTTGDMIHPEFGLIDCKVGDWDVKYNPNARDGCDFDVTFAETIERGMGLEGAAPSPITTAIALADTLEKLGPAVNIPEFDNSTGTTLKGALNKIKGAMLLAQMSMASLLSDIGSTIDGVNSMIDFASSLTDPAAWPVVSAAKGIVSALLELANTIGAVSTKKKVEIKYTTSDASPTLVASQFGIGLEDLLRANPSLATLDPVPAGTMVFVISKA